jgi:hypothetical protein
MAEPPELWTFVLANLFVFGFGAMLTTLSYWAYRKNNRQPSFRLSTIGFGILTFRFAYGIARFSEQWDAIGSKTSWDEVEPADWNVMLTKASGLVLVGLGPYFIVSGLF